MNIIVVQMADRQWTMQAMHLASAMARNTGGKVVLLHLIQIANPALLNTQLGITPPTRQEYANIDDYASVAEDYGVEVILQPMQYESYVDAIIQSVEHLKASIIFARVPESIIALWRKFQLWNMQRQLAAQKCQLYTLDQPAQISQDWTPAVTVKAAK
ncbi:MAG: hypothetical protein K8L97_09525 [Anaerolineae bacterium]|nr:hypothetical protein [Anaerolineae bacterium]